MPAWLARDRDEETTPSAEPPPSPFVNFLKYCLHGILYSIVLFLVGLPWALVGFLLVLCGGIVGLAILLVVFLILVGWANSVVTGWLWFEVKRGLGTYLLHGLVLSIALGLVSLLEAVPILIVPGLLTAIVMAVLMLPVFGLVAKAVASIWEQGPGQLEPADEPSAESP